MSKVTSKLQVTIPKAIAERYGITPGSDIVFEPAGSAIRVRLAERDEPEPPGDLAWRVSLFDAATERQALRNAALEPCAATDRGWSREALYERGFPR